MFLILIGGIVGFTYTWLTLPIAAPRTPASISEGTLYIFQLLVVNAIFPFLPLAMFFIFGAVFGRFFCGWTCPFGLVQELLALIPLKKINVSKNTNQSASEIALYLFGILLVFITFIGITRLLGDSSISDNLLATFGILAEDPLTSLDPPTTCLVWLFDDGSASSKRIFLSTQSFLKKETDSLIKKLGKLGFSAKGKKDIIYDQEKLSNIDPKVYKERYWVITLGRRKNVENFIDYCKKGDNRLVSLIENNYPHKFEPFG